MERIKIEAAQAEAERFLNKVMDWKLAQKTHVCSSGEIYNTATPKQNGALRRASMDLTRALADMRGR